MTPRFLEEVTVLVLTWNEEANLARTLAALRAFPRVVVLDSGSDDATLEIARAHRNVRVCTRAFDSHAAQWNHGLTACGVETGWVLALDADYIVTPDLAAEISALAPGAATGGFEAEFRYQVLDRQLSGSLYPRVVVLYRRERARYVQDGHTQRVVVDGEIARLRHVIVHDDRKPLHRWLSSQAGYARLEARALRAQRWSALRLPDKLRRLVVVTPWLVPLYCLTVRRGLLDGWPGVFYALQRGVAEAILSLHLLHPEHARGDGK